MNIWSELLCDIKYKIAMHYATEAVKLLDMALAIQKTAHENSMAYFHAGAMISYSKLHMRIAIAFDKGFLPAIKGEL